MKVVVWKHLCHVILRRAEPDEGSLPNYEKIFSMSRGQLLNFYSKIRISPNCTNNFCPLLFYIFSSVIEAHRNDSHTTCV
jgi:hypothetical protein